MCAPWWIGLKCHISCFASPTLSLFAAMGVKNLRGEAEAANLERRAQEIRQRDGQKAVVACMKAHPSVIEALVGKCKAMDLITVDAVGKYKVKAPGDDRPPPSLTMAAAMQRQEKRSRDKSAGSIDEAPTTSKDSTSSVKVAASSDDILHVRSDPIPTKYIQLDGLSVTLFSDRLLSKAEPQILSKPNMKLVCTYGSGKENQTALARIAEHMSGWPTDFALTGEYRFSLP